MPHTSGHWFTNSCSVFSEPSSLTPRLRSGVTGTLPSCRDLQTPENCEGSLCLSTGKPSKLAQRQNYDEAIDDLCENINSTLNILKKVEKLCSSCLRLHNWELKVLKFLLQVYVSKDTQFNTVGFEYNGSPISEGSASTDWTNCGLKTFEKKFQKIPQSKIWISCTLAVTYIAFTLYL